MRFSVRVPNIPREIETAKREWKRDHLKAARIATDRASKDAQRELQRKMRSVRLGRLANAVGQTSSLRKKSTGTGPADRAWGAPAPYGAVYARGGDNSRAGQALEAYSQGVTIRAGATPGLSWMAYPTQAAGRIIRLPRIKNGKPGFGNYRNTPSRQANRLRFVRLSPNRAMLVLDKAEVSVRTGKARPQRDRKSKAFNREKFVVMFWLIKVTTRAKRFDKDSYVQRAARNVPRFMIEALAAGRAGARP